MMKWVHTYLLAGLLLIVLTAQADTGTQRVELESRYFDTAQAVQPLEVDALSLYFQPSTVSFSSSWELRNKTKIDPGYQDRIRDSYGPMMDEEISEAFQSMGFSLAESEEEADLVGQAKMTELFINAPELDSITTGYVRRAGNVTLGLAFSRAGEEEPVLLLETNKDTRQREPGVQRAPRGRNFYDFRELTRRWSEEAAKLTASALKSSDR